MKTVQNEYKDLYSVNVFCDNLEDSQTIECHFMNFWKIPYRINPRGAKGCLATLVYKGEISCATENASTLIIPSETSEFQTWLEEKQIQTKREHGVALSFPINEKVIMALTPRRLYKYHSPLMTTILAFNNYPVIERLGSQETYLITINVVEEFQRLLDSGLTSTRPALMKIYGKIPLAYRIMSDRLLSRFWRWSGRKAQTPATYQNESRLDALRYLLLIGLLAISKREIPTIHFWKKGKEYACCLTHDIDSLEGLNKAFRFRRIEERYNVESCWNIPTHKYGLPNPLPEVLSGELGAHDTKHDGKLFLLSKRELIRRMKECRQVLTKMSHKDIEGFRAPLLQYSQQMLECVIEAGFKYDSSCSTWEPDCLHRTALKQHGIGTVYPLMFRSMVEIPVTLPQDICLLCILRNNVRESTKALSKSIKSIEAIGGLCTLLVHPDYAFADQKNVKCYEELTKNLVEDSKCWVALPSVLARWWKTRHHARIIVTEGNQNIFAVDNVPEEWQHEFEICLFVGYGRKGLRKLMMRTCAQLNGST